jgi:hypothetical protein
MKIALFGKGASGSIVWLAFCILVKKKTLSGS